MDGYAALRMDQGVLILWERSFDEQFTNEF